MKEAIAPSDLERFRELVARRLGLQYEERLNHLEDVLRQRLEASGASGLDAYLDRLGSPWHARDELRTLAERLTVSETFFFRNADNFRALTEAVIPELARADTRRLRVLSAGCASGEEPCSIAMAVREHLPQMERWDVGILALDINGASLARAREARYSPWSLRATPETMASRYFTPAGRDFVLAAAIRQMVTFEERNLVEADAAFWQERRCDLVFCRNVLMYFAPAVAREVVARLSQALLPGGYLFLGHAETLRGLSNDYHLCHTHDTFYYRKRDGIERPVPTQAVEPPPVLVPSFDAEPWVDVIQRASARIALLAERAPAEGKLAARTRAAPQISGRC